MPTKSHHPHRGFLLVERLISDKPTTETQAS